MVVIAPRVRNAMIPVVTLIGLQAPVLIGGAVIMEQIFVIPGMGLLLLEAVSQRDYPIITGVFLIVGFAGGRSISWSTSAMACSTRRCATGDRPPVTARRRPAAPRRGPDFIVRLFRDKPLGAAGG